MSRTKVMSGTGLPTDAHNVPKTGEFKEDQVIELFEAPSPAGFDGLFRASAMTPAFPKQIAVTQEQ